VRKMGHTKKIGAAGRFGPRYGTKSRKLVTEIERKLGQQYKCPSCSGVKVRRISTAIWQCARCGAKFAGAAYTPTTTITKPAEVKTGGEEAEA